MYSLKDVVDLSSLPRTLTGKIKRSELKRREIMKREKV
jgi:acyl-coenzyme A synthetase/AMP-(fatty) acid ligase